MNSPIIEAVPKVAYVAALKLAHELALELCVQCNDDHLHRGQVSQIETLLVEAGVRLPESAHRYLDAVEYLGMALCAQRKERHSLVTGWVVGNAQFEDQSITVSQRIFDVCHCGLVINLQNARAVLIRKEVGYGRGYVLRFAFRERLDV